jgi:restriction endonuclease S subunit
MNYLKKIVSVFLGDDKEKDIHWEYVRCSRCGENIPVRVNLYNDLARQYDKGSEGAYYVRKGIVGSGKTNCFQTIEVKLFFDAQRRVVSRYISGGEFITREEFQAQQEVE